MSLFINFASDKGAANFGFRPLATMSFKEEFKVMKRKYLDRKRLAMAVFAAVGLVFMSILAACGGNVRAQDSLAPEAAKELMKVSVPAELKSEMIEYPGFVVSFNSETHIPNYVAWELTADETEGSAPRSDKFRSDPDVKGCAQLDDYRHSGFDRGHMAPAADFKWSPEAMDATHFLTNICPQEHDLNAGAWQTVEKNCRNWAARDSAIIIICGPVMSCTPMAHIGETGVAVPAQFFKVVLAPFANPPRAIAFLMDNKRVVGGAQKAVVTVDEVEKVTGFDFFSALPDDIENEVESYSNYAQWQKKSR